MAFPADKSHLTASSAGQLCDGNVCSICNTCDHCGRVLNVTPHIEVCACDDSVAHYVCDEPECQDVLRVAGLL
jgi:hypothetical protein